MRNLAHLVLGVATAFAVAELLTQEGAHLFRPHAAAQRSNLQAAVTGSGETPANEIPAYDTLRKHNSMLSAVLRIVAVRYSDV